MNARRNKLKCNACQKTGHIAKVCITTLLNEKYSKKQLNSSSKSNSNEDFTKHIHEVNKNFAYDINKISNNSPDRHQNKEIIDNSTSQIAVIDSQKYFVTVLLNNKPMIFEIDLGAGYTLIPEDAFQKLNLNTPLKPTRKYFQAYTNDVFLPKGKATMEVTKINVHPRKFTLYLKVVQLF